MAKQPIYVPYGEQPPKQKVRIFTWIILAINVLFLVWVIAGVASSSGHATDCGVLDQQTCDNARNAGTAIGVGLIVFLWALVDVILGVIWLVTRRQQPVVYLPPREPQHNSGYPGQTTQAGPGSQGAQSGVPPQWMPDPQQPNQLRWWDGQRYTEHTHPR